MNRNSKIDKRYKLTDDDREMIILLNEERRRLQKELRNVQIASIARKFNVRPATIYEVLAGHDEEIGY